MQLLEIGDKAPEFSLSNQNGKQVSLVTFKGQYVILYFYPKDDTPGCTKESCEFRDRLDSFREKNAVILGISADSVASHRRFADKFALSFHLLADEDKAVIEKYGAWVEKSMYGKKYMGIQRVTYIIDPKGKIVAVFPKINPIEHAQEVLDTLFDLQRRAH